MKMELVFHVSINQNRHMTGIAHVQVADANLVAHERDELVHGVAAEPELASHWVPQRCAKSWLKPPAMTRALVSWGKHCINSCSRSAACPHGHRRRRPIGPQHRGKPGGKCQVSHPQRVGPNSKKPTFAPGSQGVSRRAAHARNSFEDGGATLSGLRCAQDGRPGQRGGRMTNCWPGGFSAYYQ